MILIKDMAVFLTIWATSDMQACVCVHFSLQSQTFTL